MLRTTVRSMTNDAAMTEFTDNCACEVAAVVLYGDPSFVKGLSWDQGTANNTSYFPRQDNDACEPIADICETPAHPPMHGLTF